MPRPSSIDRLPEELREIITQLRRDGFGIDEIRAKLGEPAGKPPVSRSALGRHVQKLDAVADRLKRSRALVDDLRGRLGDGDEDRLARLNIELLHEAVFGLLADGQGEDGTVRLDPQAAGQIAQTLARLASARRAETASDLARRKEFRERLERGLKGVERDLEAVPADQAAPLAVLNRVRTMLYGLPELQA